MLFEAFNNLLHHIWSWMIPQIFSWSWEHAYGSLNNEIFEDLVIQNRRIFVLFFQLSIYLLDQILHLVNSDVFIQKVVSD